MIVHRLSRETVTDSGIYRVTHIKHALPSELTLVAGDRFPACRECYVLKFELVRAAPYVADNPGFIRPQRKFD